MNNIEKIDVSSDIKDRLIDNLNYDVLLSLSCNYEAVNENINLLKEFKINDIGELLLYKPSIFLIDKEILIKKFSKYNIPVLVNLINEDYEVIDEILQ